MKKICFLFATCLSINAFSVLSPTAQAAVEVQKIFKSNEIVEAFGGPDFISSCEKVEGGYLVKSEDRQMLVKVVYEPQHRIGPLKFHLEFGSLEAVNP